MPVKCGLNSEVAATQRLGIAGVHCSSFNERFIVEYDRDIVKQHLTLTIAIVLLHILFNH